MSKPYESWSEIEQGIDDTYSEKDFLAVIDRDRFNATLSELDATKAALAKAEGASSALAAELERVIRADNERAEKAEAACAALRESLKEANDVACLDACDHYGDTIVHNKECRAVADLLASPNPGEGWVSPEAHAEQREYSRKVEANCRVIERERDEARADVAAHSAPCSECKCQMRVCMDCAEAALAALRVERDALTKQVEALTSKLEAERDLAVQLVKNEAARTRTVEAERDSLREQLAALNGTPQRRFTRIMEELEKTLGPHPSPYRSDEVGEAHYLRVIKANVERLGDAGRVIETAREYAAGKLRPEFMCSALAEFDAKWGGR